MSLSLNTKLVISFLIIILLPIGFFILFFSITINSLDSEVETIKPVNITKEIIKEVGDNFSLIDDYMKFDNTMKPYLKKYNIKLQILDENGFLKYDSTRNISVKDDQINLDNLNTFNVNNDKYYKYLGPVIVNDKQKAFVSLIFNMNVLFEDTQKSIFRYLITGFIITVLLALILIYFFTRYISRDILVPLKELNQVTNSIAEGNLDCEIEYDKNNELGKFCQTFDTMRKKLKKSLEKQVAYENNRKELIASISHDLRTPISSIKGYVEGLQDGVAQDREKFEHYLDIIKNKTEKLDIMIEDLFQFSRLELDRLNIEKEIYGSRQMLEEILTPYEMEYNERDINLVIERPFPDRKVKVDKNRINQVVDNLIKNADIYLDLVGIIKIEADVKKEYLRISVKDNGAGIKEEDLPYIFDKFYRGEKSRSHDYGGSGLGLAIAKEIIEEHGGSIWVKSIEGIGSTFYFTIPLY